MPDIAGGAPTAFIEAFKSTTAASGGADCQEDGVEELPESQVPSCKPATIEVD